MGYTTEDLEDTLVAADIDKASIARVVAAWGEQGDYAEWAGGFVLQREDGTFCYVSGWCDTSGWGCQSGVAVKELPDAFPINGLAEFHDDAWDFSPLDLNRWLHAEV